MSDKPLLSWQKGLLARAKVEGVAVVELRKGDRGERRYTSDEIDSLLVYVAPVDQVCWFEPEMFHDKTTIYIRYLPPKNNQVSRCIRVGDYVW